MANVWKAPEQLSAPYFDMTNFLRLLQALERKAATCRKMWENSMQFREEEKGRALHGEGQATRVSEGRQPQICAALNAGILVNSMKKEPLIEDYKREREEEGDDRAWSGRPPNLLAHLLSSSGDVMGSH